MTQDELDKDLSFSDADLDSTWESPMEFSLHVGIDCATDNTTHRLDICKFLSGAPMTDCPPVLLTSVYAYFSRAEFPPPPVVNNNPKNTWCSDPFCSLREALIKAARQAGFELVSDGAAVSKNAMEKRKYPCNSAPPYASIRFTCKQFRIFRGKKNALESGGTSHDGAATGTGTASTGTGRRPRNRISQKSLTSEQTCPFHFAVFLDKCGFLIKKLGPNQSRSTCHCHHRKRLPKDIL